MVEVDDLASKCLATNGRMRFGHDNDTYCAFGVAKLECPFFNKTRCVVMDEREERNVYWGCDYIPLRDEEYYTTN